MKSRHLLCWILVLACMLATACSPYRVHHNAPPRIAHKAYKAPVNFLNFQPRSGCGCH